jgi:hypothetical protein
VNTFFLQICDSKYEMYTLLMGLLCRNQDYYDDDALNSSENVDVETRIGNMDNIDGPSVSESDALRQGAIDVPGLQYDLPSVSSHAYSNTTQPSTMEEPQGNTQAQPLSHFSGLLVRFSFSQK